MPTTTNKDYQKIKPIPEDISPNTDVFYHPSTNEIFADYDGYFERMIQLNSAGWSCAITGKSGLTYDEALESEKDAIEQINNFPAFLETPILFIVHNYICRARIDEIVGDVMAFMRDRYFMEVVYRQTSHRRFHCRVIGIDYNGGNGSDQNINGKMNNKVNEVGISKSTSKSPAKKGNEQIGMELIPAECFTYTLQILNSKNGSDSSDSDNEESGRNNAKGKDKMPGQVFKISHLQIGRGRATFATRSRIKLFIRYYVEMSDGKLIVKPNFVVDFKLESLRWSQIFCKCPEPKFPQTRSNKKIKLESFENFEEAEKKYLNVSDRPGTSKETEKNAKKTANVKNAEFRKKRIYEQQIHLEPLFKQADKFGVQNMERWRQHFQFLSDDDIQELRLAIAEAKEMERKRQIEQRKKEREAIIEWRKPRDDLQCEDLEPFPDFKAFTWPEWIPRQFYWDIISIYSFFNNFAEVLFLDHTSPFTVCNVATAIVSHRVTEKAQFYQILDWLMTAVNKSLEEDEGSPADLSRPEQIGTESNKDIDHPVHGQNIREINKICEKQKRIHGVHIHAFTRSLLDITEVIRIHLLTSGYYTQYRRQLRGNMHCYEDDGYLFAKKENKIMDLLEKSTIFALSPRARIKLINVLMNQLLSHRRCRDLIEKRSEELANLKREFRHLKTVDQQHEKEARDGHQFLLHQNKAIDNGQNAIGGEGLKPSKSISKDLTNLRRALIQLNEGRRVQNIVEIKERMLSEENPLPWTQMENVNEIHEFRAVQRNFHSDKMQEILKSIYELQGKMGMYYLGRDRAFRRYYYMCSAFVIKCPKLGNELGECGKATQVKNKTEENSNGDAKLAKEENNGENKELVEDNMADNNGMEMPKIDPLMACSGSMQNCPVHNPSEDAPKLLYYLEKDAPKKLIHALNPRGFRELELAENIGLFKEIYSREMIETENAFAERKGLPLSSQLFGFSSLLPKELTKDGGMDGENPRIADALLGEVKKRLLELEESIYERKLGTLKCRGGREEWRKALEEKGDTIELCSVDGIPILNASNTAQLLYTKEELNSPLTPVQKLGIALIQLVHSIHPECFHSLFFSEIKKNGAVIKRNPSRTFEEWQKALKSCQSPSAVGLFEATFEYAVNWEFNQTEEKKENLTNKIGRVHRQPKSAPSSTKILPNNSKPSTSGSHRYREAEQLMANAAHLLVTGTRQRKPVTKYGECEMDIDKLDLDGDEDENEWDSNDAYDQEEEDDDDEEGDGNSNDEDKFLNGFGAERYEGLSRKRKAVTHFDPTNYHTESNKRNKEEEEEEEEIIVDEGDSDNNDEEEKGQNEDEGGRELEEWEYYG